MGNTVRIERTFLFVWPISMVQNPVNIEYHLYHRNYFNCDYEHLRVSFFGWNHITAITTGEARGRSGVTPLLTVQRYPFKN